MPAQRCCEGRPGLAAQDIGRKGPFQCLAKTRATMAAQQLRIHGTAPVEGGGVHGVNVLFHSGQKLKPVHKWSQPSAFLRIVGMGHDRQNHRKAQPPDKPAALPDAYHHPLQFQLHASQPFCQHAPTLCPLRCPMSLAKQPPLAKALTAERWQSGRMRRSRKPLSVCADPGFESLSLRHTPLILLSYFR